MKVFLSHQMSGLSKEEVMEIRNTALNNLQNKFGAIELIDNYHHEDVPKEAGRLWHLGTSIRMMEQADLIYFCAGWKNAKGCLIERQICDIYGLNYEIEKENFKMLVTRKAVVTTNMFRVGDEITVNLKDLGELTLTAQKVTEEGTYFMFNKAIANRCMNSNGKNKGGFKESDLYKWLNSDFLNLFPDELKERIKDISVPTYGQMFGHDDEFYKNFEPDNDEQFELMKDRKNRIFFDLEDKWCWSWLQNATKKEVSASYFADVGNDGYADYDSAGRDDGVLPVILLS